MGDYSYADFVGGAFEAEGDHFEEMVGTESWAEGLLWHEKERNLVDAYACCAAGEVGGVFGGGVIDKLLDPHRADDE